MNKVLVYLIGGVVVVGAITAAIFMRPDVSNTSLTQENGNTQEMGAGRMSMRDLMASSVSQKCSVTQSSDLNQSTGVVYVSGGKIRGDFDSMTAAGQMQSHMIVDGTYSYVWSSGTSQGVKTSLEAVSDASSVSNTGSADTSASIDYNQQLDYQCEPWTADVSVFALPSGVTFMDITEMMKALPSTVPDLR